MAGFLSWVQNNWFSAVGAVGIIGSLLFTAAYFREESRNRLVSNLLAVEERHRALWSEAQQRQDLKRIFSEGADVLAQPISTEEDVFLRRIVLHFETGWRLEKIMNRGEMNLLACDAGDFFSLPLPRAVWEKTKQFRHRQFVRFVVRALERKGRGHCTTSCGDGGVEEGMELRALGEHESDHDPRHPLWGHSG